jgi:S-disulfanyl-L-cysteine oxidoreductase SoxD
MGAGVRAVCSGLLLAAAWPVQAQAERDAALRQIGRLATEAEVRAWDIDVRADFLGLPKGEGSVQTGQQIWEAKCATCHGVFGESNDVFTPLVGGTTPQDIETGRVRTLVDGGYPHRTTLMKASKLSTLWDYINRAMPWNEPKSLTPNEVYAVLAYMLRLGEIVPADFTLSDRNMAYAQERLPNRHGKVFFPALWDTRGKGDVVNPACMSNCPVENRIVSALPDRERNSHGNIAEQTRGFGAARGTDTAGSAGARAVDAATRTFPDAPASMAAELLKAHACTACHASSSRIIGPSFQEIARRYADRPDRVDYLSAKIQRGGQGVWGAVAMPEQSQIAAADARAIAEWLARGAR